MLHPDYFYPVFSLAETITLAPNFTPKNQCYRFTINYPKLCIFALTAFHAAGILETALHDLTGAMKQAGQSFGGDCPALSLFVRNIRTYGTLLP